MSDESGSAAPPKTPRQVRRDRQKKLAAEAAALQVKVVPRERFSVGGRPRSLDPDQAALDKNLKTILGAGAMNCTIEEAAALHDVSVDTLKEFFQRYPDIKMRFEEARLTATASVRRNQFKLSEKSPQMAIFLGEQLLGQRDPYKMADLDQRERALELRERDIEAREKMLALKMPTDLGAGLPIDIKSLSLQQLMQLRDRIVQAMTAGGGLTIDAVASKPETEKAG